MGWNPWDNSGVGPDDIELVNFELKRLLEKRANKLPRIAPSVAAIHNKTERVEKNKVAGEKEFYTKAVERIQYNIFQRVICIIFIIQKI